MISVVKTTLQFSPAFHHRLKELAHRSGLPMSELVERYMTRALEEMDRAKIRRIYESVQVYKGMVKANIPNATRTIDEVVYQPLEGADGE